MTSVTLVTIIAVLGGVGAGVLTVAARRHATWPWRSAAAAVALLGVTVLALYMQSSEEIIPLVLFVVLVSASYAFDRRDTRQATPA